MEIKVGGEYVVSTFSYGDHPEGEVVTALSGGGTGLFQEHEIKVRCQCCDKIFLVEADTLRQEMLFHQIRDEHKTNFNHLVQHSL